MTRRSPFAGVSVEEQQALGGDLVPVLLDIVQARAAAADLPFMRVVRRLPEGWREVLTAAQAIEDIEEAECLAGAFVDLRSAKDVQALERFFESGGAVRLARAFQQAREQTAVLIDEDMDPLDIEELRDVGTDELDLRAARNAVARRAREVLVPFPAWK